MIPAQARAMYRRQMAIAGETVTLRRPSGGSPIDATVKARITGFAPDELVSGIQQGDRKVILMADDLGSWPVPISTGQDRIVVRGKSMVIKSVDDSTRRVGGTLIAYELVVAGA